MWPGALEAASAISAQMAATPPRDAGPDKGLHCGGDACEWLV